MPTKPHFFQPLVPGFEDRFFIPNSFLKHLEGQECSELTLRKGGKLWPIKINGRQFSDGWKQFMRDHDLQIGDFMVFRYEGDFVFEFMVFDRSNCERECSYPPFMSVKDEENEIETQQENAPIYTSTGKKLGRRKKPKTKPELKASSSVLEHAYPNCVIKLPADSMKKFRLLSTRNHVPRDFARENGLYGRNCSILVKDEDGNGWVAKLMYSSFDKKFMIGAGWSIFRDAHELQEGDTVILELVKNGEMPVIRIRKLKAHSKFRWEPVNQNNARADFSRKDSASSLKAEMDSNMGRFRRC